jgi:hypothetical protein
MYNELYILKLYFLRVFMYIIVIAAYTMFIQLLHEKLFLEKLE